MLQGNAKPTTSQSADYATTKFTPYTTKATALTAGAVSAAITTDAAIVSALPANP